MSLISIIMPTYNSEKYINKTILSVKNQTYSNWELIIIDDCSTDDTKQFVETFLENDERIKYVRLEKNSGAAVARNKGVEIASGDYLAFLDSDDIWLPNKLERQLNFMFDNGYLFSSTNYEYVDEHGQSMGRITKSYEKLDYHGLLKHGPGNSTIMYNVKETGKQFVPDIRKRNDYLMWIGLIKKTKFLYGLDETLTQYRVRSNSLSENKLDLIKYHWIIYRHYEKLSLLYSLYLIFYKGITTIFKNN
jgi:teichuronic acid biosynthesis glycosyltransferase TuaG